MTKKLLFVGILSPLLLVSCVSLEDKMAECENQGISKDTCYLAEMNRESAENAAIIQDNARYWENKSNKKKHKK